MEKEIELVNSGEHPNLNEKAEQNVTRHQKRIRLADALLVRKKAEIDIEFKAKRFAAFSQHAVQSSIVRIRLISYSKTGKSLEHPFCQELVPNGLKFIVKSESSTWRSQVLAERFLRRLANQ